MKIEKFNNESDFSKWADELIVTNDSKKYFKAHFQNDDEFFLCKICYKPNTRGFDIAPEQYIFSGKFDYLYFSDGWSNNFGEELPMRSFIIIAINKEEWFQMLNEEEKYEEIWEL